MPKKVVLALYNMGGPNDLQDVSRFLTELFNDNDLLDAPFGEKFQRFLAAKIIKKRLHEVTERYAQIGGRSPQLASTQNLATILEATLKGIDLGRYEVAAVTPLYRYASPHADDVFELCQRSGAQELWLYTQYPHCSRATTGSSLKHVGLTARNRLAQHKALPAVRMMQRYFEDPPFIQLWAARVKKQWEAMRGPKHLIVSAHNLPEAYGAAADPYPRQIAVTAHAVLRYLGLIEGVDWTLAWQSEVGPVQWMRPYTKEIIKAQASKGIENLLLWPIAFVSDHIETLHEIDVDFKTYAQGVGIKIFERVANLNTDDDFIAYLVSSIKNAAQQLSDRGFSPALRLLPDEGAGPQCHLQPGGCLCGRYFKAGVQGVTRGVCAERLPQWQPSERNKDL